MKYHYYIMRLDNPVFIKFKAKRFGVAAYNRADHTQATKISFAIFAYLIAFYMTAISKFHSYSYVSLPDTSKPIGEGETDISATPVIPISEAGKDNKLPIL